MYFCPCSCDDPIDPETEENTLFALPRNLSYVQDSYLDRYSVSAHFVHNPRIERCFQREQGQEWRVNVEDETLGLLSAITKQELHSRIHCDFNSVTSSGFVFTNSDNPCESVSSRTSTNSSTTTTWSGAAPFSASSLLHPASVVASKISAFLHSPPNETMSSARELGTSVDGDNVNVPLQVDNLCKNDLPTQECPENSTDIDRGDIIKFYTPSHCEDNGMDERLVSAHEDGKCVVITEASVDPENTVVPTFEDGVTDRPVVVKSGSSNSVLICESAIDNKDNYKEQSDVLNTTSRLSDNLTKKQVGNEKVVDPYYFPHQSQVDINSKTQVDAENCVDFCDILHQKQDVNIQYTKDISHQKQVDSYYDSGDILHKQPVDINSFTISTPEDVKNVTVSPLVDASSLKENLNIRTSVSIYSDSSFRSISAPLMKPSDARNKFQSSEMDISKSLDKVKTTEPHFSYGSPDSDAFIEEGVFVNIDDLDSTNEKSATVSDASDDTCVSADSMFLSPEEGELEEEDAQEPVRKMTLEEAINRAATDLNKINFKMFEDSKASSASSLLDIDEELKFSSLSLKTAGRSSPVRVTPGLKIKVIDQSGMETSSHSNFSESPIYTDQEFNFCRVQLRKSSSLKSNKTPPGTPQRKKVVRFADAMGLDLESVRHVLNMESPPKIPLSALADLDKGFDDEAKEMGSRYLYPCFSQPGAAENFFTRVRTQKVCLENAIINGLTITGFVRVSNISYHKAVRIRYTHNSWTTFYDIAASYCLNSCDGPTDRFSFSIVAPPYFGPGSQLEFAVCLIAEGVEYWDNNEGRNYMFECYAKSLPTDSETAWLQFL